jgi:hypothetical protein
MDLLLPLANNEFTIDKQIKFIESIATAAGAKPADVTIDVGFNSIESISSFVEYSSVGPQLVLVRTTITVADEKAADAIASSLPCRISEALENAGLPKATIKSLKTLNVVAAASASALAAAKTSDTLPIILGTLVGSLLLCFGAYLARRRVYECCSLIEPDDNWVHPGRKEYMDRFDKLDTNQDGYISEAEFAESLLDHYKFSWTPFKFLVEDASGLMSRKQYEDGFDFLHPMQQHEAGRSRFLCLLLRDKYHESKKVISRAPLTTQAPEMSGATGTTVQAAQAPQTPKFCVRKLQVGSSAVSARGLRSAIGLDDDEVLGKMLDDPERTLECEFLMAGDKDDIDNFYSAKDGTSGNWQDIPDHVKLSFQTGKYHGGDITESEYDTGNHGKKLEDFHKDDASVLAGLSIWMVLVLRLYTSTSFRLFNEPLRSLLTNKGPPKSQHPLRFTVHLLAEGIKKLRAVEAIRDPEGYNTPMTLWRGMADMEVDVQGVFLLQGGTEMAVMSTTCDKEVALKYSRSQRPLVFKYRTFGLSRGVSIQFLSFYPKEVEYVYPVPFRTSL